MEITLTTPAIIFPAVSLLLIAYTNRYLAITRLMRELKTSYEAKHNPNHLRQIVVLKRREKFIRNMQIFAVASIFCCTFSIALIFFGEAQWAGYVFGGGLILMLISLAISLRDVFMAGIALRIELTEMEQQEEKEPNKQV